MSPERQKKLLVLRAERKAVALVQRLDDAGHLSCRVAHRHAEDGVGPVSGGPVDGAVEPFVGVRVGDVDRLSGLGDAAGDAAADRNADLLGRAVGDPRPKLAELAIDQEERAAICLRHLRRLVEDERQQRVQVALGHHRLGDVENRGELLNSLAQSLAFTTPAVAS